MSTYIIKAAIECDIARVWQVVTDVAHYEWRSDLSSVEVVDSKVFIEFNDRNFATTFTTTELIPYKCWEFDLENNNLKGHWKGIFREQDGHTEIEFTEEIRGRNVFMNLCLNLFFSKTIKKQQERYIDDLKKACEQNKK